jgi:hypothetical protein
MLLGRRMRRYRVHFVTYDDFDLERYFAYLRSEYTLTVEKGAGTNVQTILIDIDPQSLRAMQKAIPESVHISYENA